MSEKSKNLLIGNIEIQHSVFNTKEDGLKRECVGIMLEIIKTCAAAGHPISAIEGMLDRLESNAEKIKNALIQTK